MILYCFISYPWYFCFNSQRSCSYFVLFSSSFFSRSVTHEQLISSVTTRFDSWLIMRAWTLLAPTSWCSAVRGTSQNTYAVLASYTGFGFSGEYQGGTNSASQRSCQISKKSIFGAALCRVMYLFCARAVQPARTWATLSGALLHTLHVTSPFISVCVFCQSYNLVGIIIIIIILLLLLTFSMLLIASYTLLEPGPIVGPEVPGEFFYLMDKNLLSMCAIPRMMIFWAHYCYWLQGSYLNSGPFPL